MGLNFRKRPADKPEGTLEERLDRARQAFEEADCILVGAGAGLSDAAGLKYSGPRFTDRFGDFILRYGFTDLYSSGFYPFPTPEEYWAYWARHVSLCVHEEGPRDLYLRLLELVRGRDYFVVTSNVDEQFEKAGFEMGRLWTVQGDYGYLQCDQACHDRIYPNRELVERMLRETRDCAIPSSLVPVCPVCGGPMTVYLHKDDCFVLTETWHAQRRRYLDFVDRCEGRRVLLLELGVGFNTPGIIRYPFEHMTLKNGRAVLVRLSRDDWQTPRVLGQRAIPFAEDMTAVVEGLQTSRV